VLQTVGGYVGRRRATVGVVVTSAGRSAHLEEAVATAAHQATRQRAASVVQGSLVTVASCWTRAVNSRAVTAASVVV